LDLKRNLNKVPDIRIRITPIRTTSKKDHCIFLGIKPAATYLPISADDYDGALFTGVGKDASS
jgi:hypothetical protein